MSKRWLSMLAVSWLAASAWAAEPLTLSGELQELDRVPVTRLEALDRQALLAEDAERETQPGVAPRFAIPHPVSISTQSHGLWETAHDGTEVWRQRIHATDARSINLAFSQYRLPQGTELHCSRRAASTGSAPSPRPTTSPAASCGRPCSRATAGPGTAGTGRSPRRRRAGNRFDQLRLPRILRAGQRALRCL